MRFKLTLIPIDEAVIPINYQYELSAWIYNLINKSDSRFGRWLHETGYTKNGVKKFRLFTFSNLQIGHLKVHADRMEIFSEKVYLHLSFFPVEIPAVFISGLFSEQRFVLGDKYSRARFDVKMVEKLPEPAFSGEMSFKCLSPLLVSDSIDGNNAQYLAPDAPNYALQLKKNLLNKIVAYNEHHNTDLAVPQDFDFEFEPNGKARSRLVTIKAHTRDQSKLRGYIFNFKLKAPPEIMRIGYYAGFGEKNALGFGCVEIGGD